MSKSKPYRLRADHHPSKEIKPLPCLRCDRPFLTTAERRICASCTGSADAMPMTTATPGKLYGDLGCWEPR